MPQRRSWPQGRARGRLSVALIVTGSGLRLVGLGASPSLSTRAEPCATPRRSSCVELRRSGQGCKGAASEVADVAADGTCSAAHAWCVFCCNGCDPRGGGRAVERRGVLAGVPATGDSFLSV